MQDVTGTNIQKTIFKRRDFDVNLYNEFQVNGEPNKRDLKSMGKETHSTSDSVKDEEEHVYPKLRVSNSMNNMLPSVKEAQEEAAALADEPAKKRAKIESLKKHLESQKENA